MNNNVIKLFETKTSSHSQTAGELWQSRIWWLCVGDTMRGIELCTCSRH